MPVPGVAQELDAAVPAQPVVRHVPRGVSAVGVEEVGDHRAHGAGVEVPVVHVGDAVAQVLDAVAEHEVVEVEDAEPPVAEDELLEQEVAVHEAVGHGR